MKSPTGNRYQNHQRRNKMITWVTVWVLTAYTGNPHNWNTTASQYTYATQEICQRQGEKRKKMYVDYDCNFQQVPIYVPK